MALKFLNKKGWHTGSLRNIENVWKAEQKHDAEQKKLEELRKQIHEEKERSDFRLIQEQAGLLPKQERLDFLYDSGLSVGKGKASEGFKALDAFPASSAAPAPAPAAKNESVPGALFEEKPQSANDSWRKLHSDPLLLIRQREQEALSRVKNNPVQMAIIRKSVETKKHKEKHDRKESGKKHRHDNSEREKYSSSKNIFDSENVNVEGGKRGKKSLHKSSHKVPSDSEDESSDEKNRRKKTRSHHSEYSRTSKGKDEDRCRSSSGGRTNSEAPSKEMEKSSSRQTGSYDSRHESHHHNRRKVAPKLSEEERAARLREMQVDAELHEEQRWKRLKKAEEDDVREANRAGVACGRNFLDAAHKSVYGAEKGGSSTIEESVRRRTYYLQGRSAHEGNAFRR